MSDQTDQNTPGIDPPAVGARLAEVLDDPRWAELSASLIAGGKSNLTYRLRSDAGTVILRRPPTGRLLPKAHDMGREARVQRGLASTDVPVAEILHEEQAPDLIGAPFYVMQDVPGHICRDRLPEGYALDAESRMAMGWALIDTLVALHAVDLPAVGLDTYGHAEGFLARQIGRWTKQWELSQSEPVPALDELARRLAEDVPAAQATAIVHGDYRLDNCLMSPQDPGTINAVLDWELSTLGDPLADLAMTLFYWREPADELNAMVPAVSGLLPGFPSRAELAERYAQQSGLDLAELAFYEAFARFKFAVIAQGVRMRGRAGQMGGQDFSSMQDPVPMLADEGLQLLQNR